MQGQRGRRVGEVATAAADGKTHPDPGEPPGVGMLLREGSISSTFRSATKPVKDAVQRQQKQRRQQQQLSRMAQNQPHRQRTSTARSL